MSYLFGYHQLKESGQGVLSVRWVGPKPTVFDGFFQAGDTKANCANDWLTFMASLAEVAVAGAAAPRTQDVFRDEKFLEKHG